jgi:signal transduction histidine kinase
MSTSIGRVEIRFREDVVHIRQRARLIADMLGFDRLEQTRISTAVSEIARNALDYGQGGEAEFFVEEAVPAPWLAIVVRDHGPGIRNLDAVLEGGATSRTGGAPGIAGSRWLLDHFHIETDLGQGTTVTLGKVLPPTAPSVTPAVRERIAETLASLRVESALEETRVQDQELLAALGVLRQRDEDLARVNRELIKTNAGVVALYTQLEDGTRRVQLAEQLLRARNEDLKGFASNVSHDLKAPLRGIAGYAQELERKHKDGLSSRALFCLSQILTATRNLDHLIGDLLHFARLDADTPSLAEVNLRGLVEAVLDDRRFVIAEQGVQVTVDIPFTTLRTWERGLVQVLANLIDNAIKYSSKANPPCISIRAEESATEWRLVVSDNGIGFDMKYHDRIFGLFNRLVRAEEFEGTGAGLSIVKKVLAKLGGSIRAESQTGEGAAFHVALPKPQPEAATSSS